MTKTCFVYQDSHQSEFLLIFKKNPISIQITKMNSGERYIKFRNLRQITFKKPEASLIFEECGWHHLDGDLRTGSKS